jgi:glycerol-3-phosphate dehydrogenase
MPKHSFASRREALATRPLLNPDTIRTATYYDAWISYPERLCLELLMDGEELCEDAKALSYVSLEGGSGNSVRLRDEPSGEILEVRPTVLVNATGAWIDFTNRLLGRETEMIGGTKGAHLVLDNDALLESLNGQMVFYETPDGRVSVALPWLGKPLIGSTDIRVEDPDQARCDQEEIDYMLGAIREAFPKLEIDRSQILSVFSGVRPLGRSGGTTVTVSRAHQCRVIDPGDGIQFPVYCMVGGKWTPFRAFAQHVTDMLMEHFGRTRHAATEELPIGGGKDYPGTDEASDRWLTALQERTNLDRDRLLVLLERYGTRAEQVAAFCVDSPDGPLRHHERYTRREIEFIVSEERVIHLDDIVLRRTSIALLGELTGDLLDELAQIAAAALQWSPDQIRREMDRMRKILLDRHRIEL